MHACMRAYMYSLSIWANDIIDIVIIIFFFLINECLCDHRFKPSSASCMKHDWMHLNLVTDNVTISLYILLYIILLECSLLGTPAVGH